MLYELFVSKNSFTDKQLQIRVHEFFERIHGFFISSV
jgi:hypothetical protein